MESTLVVYSHRHSCTFICLCNGNPVSLNIIAAQNLEDEVSITDIAAAPLTVKRSGSALQ